MLHTTNNSNKYKNTVNQKYIENANLIIKHYVTSLQKFLGFKTVTKQLVNVHCKI